MNQKHATTTPSGSPAPTAAALGPARINVLRDRGRARFAAFRGGVLDDAPDDVLQQIVAEAAAVTGQPAAAVTLLLERTQRIRASVGLTDDMRETGGIDRSVTLCQYVVRDEAPFVVEETQGRTDIPSAALDLGVRRYVGVPVSVEGHVVGSLCVVGGEPGPASAAEVDQLTMLARRASARLAELAGPAAVVRRATASVFGELRNALAAVLGAGGALRFIAADLAPVQKALRARAWTLLPLLDDAAAAIDELVPLAFDLDIGATRATSGVVLLESVLQSADRHLHLKTIVERALALADHVTKVHGGVRLKATLADADHSTCAALTCVLGSALVELARGTHTGVDVDIDVRAGAVVLVLRSAVPVHVVDACVATLRPLTGEVEIDAFDGTLILRASLVRVLPVSIPVSIPMSMLTMAAAIENEAGT